MRRDSAVCVVPMHREVDQGTLRGVLRQVGVSELELPGRYNLQRDKI